MSTSLRRAARALRASLEPRPSAASHGAASATALTVMVESAGRAELVSLRLRDGALHLMCTCGAQGCAHTHEALGLFDDEPRADGIEDRITHVFEPAMRLSDPPPMPVLKGQPEGRNRLSDVLADVVLAVTRAGVNGGISPAEVEALERLAEHAGPASASGLRVWVGALKTALEARDTEAAVRALAACSAMIDALRKRGPQPIADAHVASWLGGSPSIQAAAERVTERTYLELAREHRPGLLPAGIEQRYLVDLATGELLREDRAANESSSLGPCPRLVSIGLAHVEPGHPPRRIRLLQYTTTPFIEASAWASVARFALPSFESLLSLHREHMTSSAGLTDLVVLVRPSRVDGTEQAHLVDDEGRALRVLGREGTAQCLQGFMLGMEPEWLLGRVHAHAGVLAIVPLAACGLRHGRSIHLHL